MTIESISRSTSTKNVADPATCNNPNLDLVNVNPYAKFGLISSIHSQDTEQKQNSDNNQGAMLFG